MEPSPMSAIRLEPASVRSIEMFSKWVGFADPPHCAEAYRIVRDEGEFILSRLIDGANPVPIPYEHIQQLLAAIANPIVTGTDCGSYWTDDYPEFRIKVLLTDDDVIVGKSTSQISGMIPWEFKVASTGESFRSDNPELGPAIGRILPAEALNGARLRANREQLRDAVNALIQADGELSG
jgi:hypothetical protein